jgi:hypothetical protein
MKLTRKFATIAAAVALSFGGVAVASVVTAGAALAVPGCSNNYYVANTASGTPTWFANGSLERLDAGNSTDYFCGINESGGWQLIKDVTTGNCVGVDGNISLYEKPCDGTRAFELFQSVGDPNNSEIWNDYTTAHYPCQGTTNAEVITYGNYNDSVSMSCPLGTGHTYTSIQKWTWVI